MGVADGQVGATPGVDADRQGGAVLPTVRAALPVRGGGRSAAGVRGGERGADSAVLRGGGRE